MYYELEADSLTWAANTQAMSQLVLAEFECDETRSRAHRVARKRQAPIVSLAATGSHRGNFKLERVCMPTLDRPFLIFGASSYAGFLGGI